MHIMTKNIKIFHLRIVCHGKQLKFKIQSYKILEYKPNGMVYASKKYNNECDVFSYENENIIKRAEFSLTPVPVVLLKDAKIRDIKSLLKFMQKKMVIC